MQERQEVCGSRGLRRRETPTATSGYGYTTVNSIRDSSRYSLFPFLKKKLLITHNHLTFQVTVRTTQSFTKVHFKVELLPSNVSHKFLYPWPLTRYLSSNNLNPMATRTSSDITFENHTPNYFTLPLSSVQLRWLIFSRICRVRLSMRRERNGRRLRGVLMRRGR